MSDKEIRDASTVVLLRDRTDDFEVLMMRRHKGHEFMANAWVFPGGRIDDRDLAVENEKFFADFDRFEAARRLGGDIDERRALALYVAALRETFEEAGILLATRHDEQDGLTFDDGEVRRRFQGYRDAVDGGVLGLVEVCRREKLELCAAELVYFAHWITPDFESRRYNTRFFAAMAPPGQEPSHDRGEMTELAWWTPGEAIESYRNSEIFLAPPTLRILEELSDYDSTRSLLGDLAKRGVPPAILPHLSSTTSGEVLLVLPGDPEYPDEDPAYAMATPIRHGVTRIVRRDGQWHSVHGDDGD